MKTLNAKFNKPATASLIAAACGLLFATQAMATGATLEGSFSDGQSASQFTGSVVGKDNNYAGAGGPNLNSNNTELLRTHLTSPEPESSTYSPLLAGLGAIGLFVGGRRKRD